MNNAKTLRKKRGRPRKDWMHDLAIKSGRSVRAIQLDAERGEKIAPDVLERVCGTKLDAGAYLDVIKNLSWSAQREQVEHDLSHGRAKPGRNLTRLESAWLDASEDERERFLQWIKG